MKITDDFKIPSWLNDQDVGTIHKRMLEALPADIDNTEGGFPWDFTRPTAIEKAEMLQFHLVETLKIMHPAWAYGEWLDQHADNVGLERKSPTYAYGVLEITGVVNTSIPAGFMFAVPAVGEKAAVGFETLADCIIPQSRTAEVRVKAVEAGPSGNVAADTITIMMSKPITGIQKITNPERTSGGTEEETDDALRERIREINIAADGSFVGCDADYIRWAKEIDGVGTAYVIPQWDPDVPNSVKLVLLDSNGEPANPVMTEEVYNYIMSPDDRLLRKAPIGAILTIDAPKTITIGYSVTLILEEDADTNKILEVFRESLVLYYVSAKEEKVVRYYMVGSILISITGVKDYKDLKINGSTENIPILDEEYPITGDIAFEVGEDA